MAAKQLTKQAIIKKTAQFVQKKLEHHEGGHNWWHVYRVCQNARLIAKNEKVDLFTVELTALLHDIADYKFHKGDISVGPKVAREWLERLGVGSPIVKEVCTIIGSMSYSSSLEKDKTSVLSKEGQVVQDADRLDALGAIGIARTFNYGGAKGREIYNPAIKQNLNQNANQYRSSTTPTLNHFYEKLLLLKDRMNTKTGKRLAEGRHRYMERFLEKFYREWEGKE